MRITIDDAEGGLDEIKEKVAQAIIAEFGPDLQLISAQRACGIFDLTMNSFNDLELPKVDLLGNGRTIRYRLADLKTLIEERTIKPMRRKRRKKPGDE